MGTYFKDPYKKYYEKLNGQKDMVGNASTMVTEATNVVAIIQRLQSQVNTALWQELGYQELVTTSIPGLKARVDLLSSNITSALAPACKEAIETLLPLLENFKQEDENYEKILSDLNSLIEPANMYQTKYNEKTGKYESTGEYTAEYSSYLDKKSELEGKRDESKEKLKTMQTEIDAEIEKVKAFNGTVQDFNLDTEGKITEVAGLTLTEGEKQFIEALEKSISNSAEEEGVDYDTKLTELSEIYPTGKTVLYNDAGGKKYGYSRKILTSHGKMVTVFQQAWNEAGLKYRDTKDDIKTIRGAGCGYNALASIMTSKYPNMTPEQLFKEMGRKSLFSNNIKKHLEKNYNIKVGYRDDLSTGKKEKIIKEVVKGNMVMSTVVRGPDAKYTKSGHWVAIVDYDPTTDSFYVTDSNDQDDSNAGPINATRFLRDYEVSSNIIYIADDSGYYNLHPTG